MTEYLDLSKKSMIAAAAVCATPTATTLMWRSKAMNSAASPADSKPKEIEVSEQQPEEA